MTNRILFIIIFIIVSNPVYSQIAKWFPCDSIDYSIEHSLDMEYKTIDFIDNMNCAAIGNMAWTRPWLRITNNGGKNWYTAFQDDFIYKYDSNGNVISILYRPAKAADIDWVDDSLCIIICDSAYYWRSTDGLKTWKRNKVDAIYKTNQIFQYKIEMFDNKFGGFITPFQLFLTEDGGESFYEAKYDLPDSLLPVTFIDLFFPSRNTIIALVFKSSYSGYIIKSIDGGKHWNAHYSSPLRLNDIYFVNEQIGYGAGRTKHINNLYRDLIYKTIDGGMTWQLQLDSLAPNAGGLFKIQFINENEGIALGYYNSIWRTSDGGEHWTFDTSYKEANIKRWFSDIVMIKSDLMFATAERSLGGFIYKYSKEETAINEEQVDNDFSLNVFPNPSKGSLIIKISNSIPLNVKLELYDYLGNRVTKLFSEYLEKGIHNYEPNLDGISNGMYFLKLTSSYQTKVKAILIMK